MRPEQFPRREGLTALAHHYHHLQSESKRRAPGSGIRRRIEDRQIEVRQRFDCLLDEWVPSEELRELWLGHLKNRSPVPPGPEPIRPLMFRGFSEARAEVEIRRNRQGELDVEVDGSLLVRVAADRDLLGVGPLHFRLDRTEYHETFAASAIAIEALSEFVREASAPPWDHVPELVGDGLLDFHAALTPRGRRALSPGARRAGSRTTERAGRI